MRLILFFFALCVPGLPGLADAGNLSVVDSYVYGTFGVPSGGGNDHYELTRGRVGLTAQQNLLGTVNTASATVSVDLVGDVAPYELFATLGQGGATVSFGQFRSPVLFPFPGPQDIQTPRLPMGTEQFVETPVGIRFGYARDSFVGFLANVEEGRFAGGLAVRDTLCDGHATMFGAFAEQKVGFGALAGMSLYGWVNPTVGFIRINGSIPDVRETDAFVENYVSVWEGGRIYGRLETGRGAGVGERGIVGFTQEWKPRSFGRFYYNTGSERFSADFTVSF